MRPTTVPPRRVLPDTKPYLSGPRETCGHCNVVVKFEVNSEASRVVQLAPPGGWAPHLLRVMSCPSCFQLTLDLIEFTEGQETAKRRLHPVARRERRSPPNEVPEAIRREYMEAARVEPVSDRAAAALARWCLQLTLRDKGYGAARLVDEIESAAADLPSALVTKLHFVREVGNYAVHPTEENATGDLLRVEAGEVDALFGVLSALFDEFYVRPVRDAKWQADINAKLASAGRKPIQ